MDKLTEKEKENFEANYRKLWLIGKVNYPFVTSVVSFQEYYNLPVKCSKKDYLEKSVEFLDGLEDKKVDFWMFIDEVVEIMTRFGFESFWFISFLIYLITDQILPPYKKRSKKVPPKGVVEGWRIFTLEHKKAAQYWFLKVWHKLNKKKIKEMDEDYNIKNEFEKLPDLPYELIRSQLGIAQMLWGDKDDEDWAVADRKMKQNVKQKLHRFRKLFVPCTKADLKAVR